MIIVDIKENKIKLLLTQPLSKVRIADQNGNHIKKPLLQGRNEDYNYIEWMITNEEVEKLIKHYLDDKDTELLKNKLRDINSYLKGSKFASRKATKEKLDETFLGFKIYKYREEFYSFEKILKSGIGIRLTFKMGDFTLAVHMFVLLPFCCETIELFDKEGSIEKGNSLGSGAFAIWTPNKGDVISIVEGLAHASESHKEDLMKML